MPPPCPCRSDESSDGPSDPSDGRSLPAAPQRPASVRRLRRTVQLTEPQALDGSDPKVRTVAAHHRRESTFPSRSKRKIRRCPHFCPCYLVEGLAIVGTLDHRGW